MRKTIGTAALAAILMASTGAYAQEADVPQEEEKAPGPRLTVRFEETRLRGNAETASRSCAVTLHADSGRARLFVGTQEVITVHEQVAPTQLFKNAGTTAEVEATRLDDGRYRLAVRFEEGSALTEGVRPGENPILRVVNGESEVILREGETVPFASAVDPVTGEVVRVGVALDAAPQPQGDPLMAGGDGPLRGRVVLVRREGATQTARRPYAVVLKVDGEGGSRVFSGSQIPIQVKARDQITVAFKDVGAGLRIEAHRVADGRYRVDVEFEDFVLVPRPDTPALRGFESSSRIFVRPGETVTLASLVDAVTGETVEAELTLEESQ